MKYHKIQSLYKRHDNGSFDRNSFTRPEFEYLYYNGWEGTEKIDGTNIRIYYSPFNKVVDLRGRTDKARLPKHLLDYLFDVLTPNKLEETFPETEETTANSQVILYGEGFGHKIQKGEKYLGDDVGLALFDVFIGGWWLRREDVRGIAQNLGVYDCPVVFAGTLEEAEEKVRKGFRSVFGTADAEGLVLRPHYELFDRSGQRIITKLKTKDYR